MMTKLGKLFLITMFSLVVMGVFLLNERVVSAQGVTVADTIAKVQETHDVMAALDPSVFVKPKNQNTLTKKLNKVINKLGNDNYNKALDILEKDIIDTLDGCDLISEPDEDDKILDCVAQGSVFPLVVESINMIGILVFDEDNTVMLQGTSPGLAQNGNINITGNAIIGGNLDAAGGVGINGSTVIDANGQWVGNPTGLVGPQGPAGADGADGSDGAQGQQGDPGPQGIQGLVGPQGPQGPIGLTGAKGDKGDTGDTGPAGADGADGAQGPAGDSHWLLNGLNTYYNDGNVGIGTTSPLAPFHVDASVSWPTLPLLSDNSVDNRTGAGIRMRKSRGTPASKTIVNNDDVLGAVHFFGYDGADYQRASSIAGRVDGAPGSGNMPGRLVFSTNDGTSILERMRIDNSGNVGIGTTSPVDILNVNGNVRVGIITDENDSMEGYGDFLFFSGGDDWSTYNSENSDPLWIARYNEDDDFTELRINIGDNPFDPNFDKLVIGAVDNHTNRTTWEPRMTVLSTGNVGIGTMSPLAKLHVGGTAGVDGIMFPDGTLQTTATLVGPQGPQGPAGAGGADGVTGPQGIQGIQGPAGPQGPAGTDGAEGAQGPAGPQGPQGPAGADGGDLFDHPWTQFGTDVYYNGGNVGIGTTSPERKLDVAGGHMTLSTQGTTFRFQDGATINSLLGVAAFTNNMMSGTVQGDLVIQNDLNNDIFFGTNGDKARMLIQNNGNVGIGTTSPGAKLHIETGASNDALSITGTDQPMIRMTSGIGTKTWRMQALSEGLFFIDDGAPVWRFGIAENGNVGIGTTNPTQLSTTANTLLNVHTPTSRAEITISAAGIDGVTDLSMGRDSTYNMIMRFDGQTGSHPGNLSFNHTTPTGVPKQVSFVNSSVGIGRIRPTESLDVVGNIIATGSITQGSSRELKKNITYVSTSEAVEALKSLNPVKFLYKADNSGEEHLGFIAEDVPDLVATQDRKRLSPMDITAVLTKVVKEQQEQIKQLKNENEQLRSTLTALTDRQESIENMMLAISTNLPKEKLVKYNQAGLDEVQ